MASVFLARLVGPANFENLVVIKRMLPHLAEDPRFREMFADEARTVARIRHPNVVRTFELVDERDELYLVMEYLEGETLQKLLRTLSLQKETLSVALACHVVAEAAAGLHAAHELQGEEGENLGVVHRDVSPHNLFVTFDGGVKVIDFGIAKSLDRANQTSTGEVKGKFAYMSPEQVAGQATSRRTDVFAICFGARAIFFGGARRRVVLGDAAPQAVEAPLDERAVRRFRQLGQVALEGLERDGVTARVRRGDAHVVEQLRSSREIEGALEEAQRLLETALSVRGLALREERPGLLVGARPRLLGAGRDGRPRAERRDQDGEGASESRPHRQELSRAAARRARKSRLSATVA